LSRSALRQQRIPRTPQAAAQKTFGDAVRELRACRVISQEELGFRARLHRNYVGALERGEINPTFKTLRALASGLEVELSSLIRLYEERHEDGWLERRLRNIDLAGLSGQHGANGR
jgi:transcriptional regulator with XRE-family HTH domain